MLPHLPLAKNMNREAGNVTLRACKLEFAQDSEPKASVIAERNIAVDIARCEAFESPLWRSIEPETPVPRRAIQMDNRIRINDEVVVGGQPDEHELARLREGGFKSIVNLRDFGEEKQPLSPTDEGRRVRELGLQYVHIGVPKGNLQPDQVDMFRATMPGLPKPAFVHCESGKRSGAFVMMHLATERGMTGEETLRRAEQLGFECDKQELRDFVKSYVDQHAAA
jgi:uncharacterized protein (TIGR01244 family)